MKNTNKKYDCTLEALESTQLQTLNNRINNFHQFHPWLGIFVERFYKLAHEKNLSKAKIIQLSSSLNTHNQLLDSSFSLSKSTLSENTNFESKQFRAPNIDTLIALSECFGTSIDYLVGKTNCYHPEYCEIHETTGLSDEAIISLKSKQSLLNLPRVTPFPNNLLPFTASGAIDIEQLPQIHESGLFTTYYRNKKSHSHDDLISDINNTMRNFPEYFDKKYTINLDADLPNVIAEKLEYFEKNIPNIYFFETLNLLLTYENGYLITLISQYIFGKKASVSFSVYPYSQKAKPTSKDNILKIIQTKLEEIIQNKATT